MPHTRLRPAFTFTEDRLAELRRVAPEAFADGRVNWESLREALGEFLEPEDGGAEHFGLFWPGKREARRLAAMPSRGTLVPVPGEGVDEDTTRNLFIEGDNLEVLKLLRKSYAGRVKMIYIDPPYNTGNDFVYADDFSEPLDAYLRRTGKVSEEGESWTTNTRADGRFHSKWLSMMYPRLLLARQLLASDGVLLASIDDNEVHNLRALLGEVFGEENFVGCVVWERKRKGSHLSKKLTLKTEYILVFGANGASVELFGEPVGLEEDGPLVKRTNAEKVIVVPPGVVETTLPDGMYPARRYGDGSSSVELLEPAQVSNGRFVSAVRLKGPFVWNQAKVNEEAAAGGRFFIRTMNFSLRALKADQASGFKALSSLLTKDVGTNEDAKSELAELLGLDEENLPIDYPKPSSVAMPKSRSL
ncbi:MAG: site-specific DNA-methyltransferase [Gemmatimonadaceae bacterium]